MKARREKWIDGGMRGRTNETVERNMNERMARKKDEEGKSYDHFP